jgi:uncharacterized protein YqeY
MTLKEQILKDFMTAFKAKDMVTKDTLSMLKSEVANAEIDLGVREEGLSDEETLKVIKRAAKKRKDAIAQFTEGGNIEMAEGEKAELEVLEKYLPEQMGEEALEEKIKEIIEKVGASNAGDLGKVMGAVMAELGAEADGNVVRKIASKLLA